MTVIRPNSISGVSSITGQGGDIKIFRADGTAADVTVNNITSGIITGTHYGSGANLTNLPAGNLTGNLPAISAANLTSIPAANLTGTVADARLTSVTASKLSGALPALDGSALTGVGLGTDGSANTSGIITATAFVPTTGQLSNRNLVINGAMTVAQRGTSSTTQNAYTTVDRWKILSGGLDEGVTTAQSSITSGLAYNDGFRKAYKVQNGNQTSGAGASDYLVPIYRFESQDLANSGWDYVSSSSFITISFYVKSSVAQTFQVQLYNGEPTQSRQYVFEYSATTSWTRITHTVPGGSGVEIDNDTSHGFDLYFNLFHGTGSTNNSYVNNQWNDYGGGNPQYKDNTSTWYTTNDATWEITGLQVEVGFAATPFEHISYQENFRRCCRYYWKSEVNSGWGYGGYQYASGYRMLEVRFPVIMRVEPTATVSINHGGTGFAGSREQYKAYTSRNYNSGDNVHTTSAVFDSEL